MEGLKWVPSALTLANLACGFSVFLVDPKWGMYLILLGAIFDLFDGAAARALNATSEIGAQLDSLADMVTFGAAPAFLLSQILDDPWRFLVILPVLAAAWRLAKFNISGGETHYFLGMPTPASALFLLGIFIASFHGAITIPFYLILFAILLISFLNVSSLKMFSFKGLQKDKLSLPSIVLCGLIGLVCYFFQPWLSLFAIFFAYVMLSILYHLKLGKTT